MAKERVSTYRNVGTASEPNWEKYFVKTLAECIMMSDADTETKTIKDYVDEAIDSLVSDVPEGYDTFKKLADAITENEETIETLNSLVNEIKAAIAGSSDLPDAANNIIKQLGEKIPASEKGAASGVAELDTTGKVPVSQLPSYVDDVITGYLSDDKFYEEESHTTVITGEDSKIYVDKVTNKTYRWSGSAFVEISASLALGETDATAYRGDRGAIAYEHSQKDHAPADAERNLVIGVQKNGTDITPDENRKVNVEVPTKVSQLDNDKGFLDKNGTIEHANKLATPRSLEGMDFDGSSNISHYCVCSTSASVAGKVLNDFPLNLDEGARVIIKFANTNTAPNPMLKIGNTDAKAITYHGAAIPTDALKANHTYEFVYNGENYELVGDINTDTTYGEATTSQPGLMSAEDKTKVDAMPNIAVSAEAPTTATKNSLWFKIDKIN